MITAAYDIVGGDFNRGGSASRQLKEQLKKVGADPAVMRRVMIAAYEAEMNVVIHAHRGILRFELKDGRLEIEVRDEGPGIVDIEQALRPGYSSAPPEARALGFGAGMGLPNIRRSSDEFHIESTPGQGTVVRIVVRLKARALYGQGRHSLAASADLCRSCFRCLPACPTGALRVRHGRPEILDYLCVDCTECTGACPSEALHVTGPFVELEPQPDMTLVVASPALAQFGPGVSPQRVLEELGALGFAHVLMTDAWQAALRRAVIAHARARAAAAPWISPVCPAVVNLIETRYPALIPQVAPFLSPLEAIDTALDKCPTTFVFSCPCQQTAVEAQAASPPRARVAPRTFRNALLPRLRAVAGAGPAPADRGMPVAEEKDAGVLTVSGMPNVAKVLERVEDGDITDVTVLELFACEAEGFGSPLLAEPGALARHRWAGWPTVADALASAVPRRRPLAPRPGLRLDEDMARAVQKLGRIERLRRELPGDDCCLCGAPGCAAFAEDVVLGRARREECPRPGRTEKESP